MGLVLSRRVGEQVVLTVDPEPGVEAYRTQIVVELARVGESRAKLRIVAPEHVRIDRAEVVR